MADRDDELLQKADALMRRRRVFVAGSNEAEAAASAGAASAESAEEDVPLLTDVVSPDALPNATASVDVGLLRRTLAAELESWLDNELPAHVQHVLDGITDQMIIQLSRKAREELLPKLEDILAAAREGAKPAPADD